ncbi:MAG TPA: Zn-dependent hydrolase [Gemmatimonadales bacterium]|nr:Zn-dependent hydrolase [Gemmatimonadales bacterium]
MNRRQMIQAALLAGVAPELAFATPRSRLRADGRRVSEWLRALSRFGANPDGGVSRTGFSAADVEGRAWLRELMESVGLTVRIDPAGNILGELPGTAPGLKPLLFGSHIDSVPHGGNYDGDLGSLASVEVIATMRERGYKNRHPLWVTVWCDEERGLTGSRGFIGQVTPEQLASPYVEGLTLGECIKKIGGDPAAMATYKNEPGSIAGYVELHIEQGAVLDRSGIDVGVVEGIVTIRSAAVTITGFANHAGTTPMAERKNALLAAAELTLAVDRIVKQHPGRQVGTVGRLQVSPGASNVIPGQVDLTIELRDLDAGKLETIWNEIRAEGDAIMQRWGTSWTPPNWRAPNPAAYADAGVRSVIAAAATDLGLSTHSMPSGAGHDAQMLARIGPMGMIFVPSVDGISHSPKEYTRPEDVANGANVLLQTILRLDQQ